MILPASLPPSPRQSHVRGATHQADTCPRPDGRKNQRGYALLLILFLVAALAIAAMAVAPSVLTEGRRQQEEEMIWRGNQYIRGIRMYYRKLGKFPNSLDDLTKPKTGTIRFMRAAYKDPMNKEDGSWRLIYVGPAGQLIGSLKPQQNLQIPGASGFGTAASSVAAASAGSSPSTGTSGFGNSSGFGSSATSGTSSGFGAPAAGGAFGNTAGSSTTTDTSQPYDPATDPMLNPPPSAGTDAPTIIGGNIIGVGSKINKHSIKVYDKAKNYLVFEFVWNPAKDQANAIQQLNGSGTGLGTPIGGTQQQSNPFGPTPTNGSGPGSSPTAPPTQTPAPQ